MTLHGNLPERCVLIGTSGTLIPLAAQLGVLARPPRVVGVFLWRDEPETSRRRLLDAGLRPLGLVRDLESLLDPGHCDAAIVSLPAAMSEAIVAVRTTLRRLRVPDRFIATLEDQLAGVGPRTEFEIDVADLIDRAPRRVDERAVARLVRGRRVLITGAGGSIGSELATTVARFEPAELQLMERAENALFEIDRRIARRHPDLPRAAWLHDVTDAAGTLGYCRRGRPEVVFHAAAHKHVPMMEDHPVEAVRNNFFGTRSIADACLETGSERFVMISTDKAVNPASIMGATKRLAELYVQGLNGSGATRFGMVRFGNVLGSAGSVLPVWSKQIRDGGPLTVTHRDMTRYFMTIPEAASLVLQAAAMMGHSGGGEVFVLDMGEPIRILDLAMRFVRAHGLEPYLADEFDAPPDATGWMPIVFTGIRPGEKLTEQLAYDVEELAPTGHPGIQVWKTTAPDPERVADMIDTLEAACAAGDPDHVVTALHRLLPEVQTPGGTSSKPVIARVA